ncbi:MAG: hypothetical protein Q9160_001136 [Pyrenula sp. 1 TL-2023]
MQQTSLLSFFTAKSEQNDAAVPQGGLDRGNRTKQTVSSDSIQERRLRAKPSTESTWASILCSESSTSPTADTAVPLDQPSTPPSSPPLVPLKPELSDNLTHISTFYSPRAVSPSLPSRTSVSSKPACPDEKQRLQFRETSLAAHEDNNAANDYDEFAYVPSEQKPTIAAGALKRSPNPSVAHLEATLPDHTNSKLSITSPSSSTNSYTIAPISSGHIPTLRTLTTSLLPIKYANDFYSSTLQPPTNSLSFTVLYQSEPPTEPKPIGWIRTRLDPQPTPPLYTARGNPIPNSSLVRPRMAIYISVLCLAAPHRTQGLATQLLQPLLSREVIEHWNVQFLYAHVWERNESALEWYEKRGFKRQGLVEGYYRKLRPTAAWVVRMDV